MITERSHPRGRGDAGTSLIIAMAFLGLLGATVVSMLVLTAANFTTHGVVRSVSGKNYGAGGGIDVALELLRSSPSYCPDVSGTPQSLPDQTINGMTVQATCQTISGTVGGTGGGAAGVYAVVVTGYDEPHGGAPDFTKLVELDGKDKDGNDTIRVQGGHVFNAGKFNFKSDSPTLIVEKNLDQYDTSGYCTTDKAAAVSSGNPSVTGTWTCQNAGSFPVPDPNPTLIVPTALAPTPITQGNCTIYFPGKYTDKLDLEKDEQYYFASGVYYFHDAGDIRLQGEVFGGAPGPGITRAFTSLTPCSNDATANALRPGTATGYGVQFVLGDGTKIKVEDEKKAKVELFARVPADPALEGTAGVTIYAPKVSGPNYTMWDKDRALDIKGKDPQLVIHGLVYMPTSKYDEQYALGNEDANAASIFDGGIVVQRLKLKFKKDAANLTFARIPETAATTRTTVVTATATDPSGGAPTTVRAVVSLGATPGSAPTILSWRKT